jgi:hypothetical protein
LWWWWWWRRWWGGGERIQCLVLWRWAPSGRIWVCVWGSMRENCVWRISFFTDLLRCRRFERSIY